MKLSKRIKYKFSRWIIYWINWYRSIDMSMTPENRKLNRHEEKAIKLWKILLKDETTQLSYNLEGVRQIEKEHLFIMFHPSSNRYTMTVMDVSTQGRCLYELHIPTKDSKPVLHSFDDEMIRRMSKAEENKRKIIESDIDKLLEKEEEFLKNSVFTD